MTVAIKPVEPPDVGVIVGVGVVDPVEPPLVDEKHRDEPVGDVWSDGHGWHMD